MGEVWRAPFEPFKTIQVAVGLADDRAVGTDRLYIRHREEAVLVARYGPRPAPAR